MTSPTKPRALMGHPCSDPDGHASLAPDHDICANCGAVLGFERAYTPPFVAESVASGVAAEAIKLDDATRETTSTRVIDSVDDLFLAEQSDRVFAEERAKRAEKERDEARADAASRSRAFTLLEHRTAQLLKAEADLAARDAHVKTLREAARLHLTALDPWCQADCPMTGHLVANVNRAEAAMRAALAATAPPATDDATAKPSDAEKMRRCLARCAVDLARGTFDHETMDHIAMTLGMDTVDAQGQPTPAVLFVASGSVDINATAKEKP